MSAIKLKETKDYEDFATWCSLHNKHPMATIKKYCRYTVIYGENLIEMAKKYQEIKYVVGEMEKDEL